MAKISIRIASKGNNNFDLSSNHITTTDFGQIQVSNFLPVIPNDKIRCSLFSEARFAPMVVPTFMDVKLITRSFYVPMSAIYQPFEYFYTDKQDASVFKTMPSCTNNSLASFFSNSTYGLSQRVGDDVERDFQFVAGGSTYNYIFTEKGRLFLKLVHSLGYSINWSSADTTPFSLLPILAFARVCYDYVYPSQYLDGLGLTAYFKISSSSDYSALLGDDTKQYTFFSKVCDLLTLPYKQDYFTASWKNLNAPGTSVQNLTKYSPDGHAVDSSGDNVVMNSFGDDKDKVSMYMMQLAQRMYDFVTRNNIVGTRFADQLFARFGIGSRKSDPDMSQFIGQHIQPINVIDVTAMSAGQGQELGELAGKAYLQGKGNLFSFDSVDEFGYIISLSFVMPEIGYYQGRKRWTTQFSRFDFVHPEFDMQMRAVRNDELFADFKSPSEFSGGASYGGTPNYRFSFAPTFSEYKKGDDYLTGDFRCSSLARNLGSYHLMRDLLTPSSQHPLALNAQFLFCQQHQFDKIFAQQYVMRAPLSLREVGDFGASIVCYDLKPIVFVNSDSEGTATYDYVCLAFQNNKGKFDIRCYDTDVIDLDEYFGIDLEDDTTFYEVPFTHYSNGNKYQLASQGVELWIHDRTANKQFGQNSYTPDSTHLYELGIWVNSGSTYVPFVTYDDFLSNYRDYIDHIYLRHRFDIKASRSLQPISEEFMIEDGGKSVSVDMNGNRIV